MQRLSYINQSNYSTSLGYAYKECFKTTDYGIIYCYCIMSLSFLVGSPANLWCLWFYLRAGCRIKANHMFPVYQTIIELIGCIENAIQILNEFVFLDETVFYVDNFIYGTSWSGKPLLQTCICIEQYMAVIHPVTFLTYKDLKYKLTAVVMVYLIASSFGVYEIYHWEFPDPVFNLIYFVVVIIMSFCCVSVLFALRRSGPGQQNNRSTHQEETNQQKRKAFNIIFTNLLIMLFTYVPMLVLTVCYVIKDNWVLYYCVLGPMLSSMCTFCQMITPMLRLYKEGFLQCLKRRN